MSYGYQGGSGNAYGYPTNTETAGYRHPQPPPPDPLEPEYAGFGIRVGARLLDELFVVLATMVVAFFLGILFAIVRGPKMPSHNMFASMGVSLVVGCIAHAIAEGTGGASLGKMVLGLRVRDENGGRASFGAALGRSFAYLIDAMFFGLVAKSAMDSSPRLQRYGDRWAHTVVVYTRSLNEPERSRSPLVGALVATLFAAVAVSLDTLLF